MVTKTAAKCKRRRNDLCMRWLQLLQCLSNLTYWSFVGGVFGNVFLKLFFGGASPTLRKLLCYCQGGAVAGGVPELEEFVVHSGYYHLEAAHFLYGEELADEGAG